MAGPVFWGSKILLKEASNKNAAHPQIAALNDGTFAAVWTDVTGTEKDIRGQIFNADGTKKGDEFLVHSAPLGNQEQPAIAVLSDGRFVVAWCGNIPYSSQDNDIKAQVFKADGTKDGHEILVNHYSNAGSQAWPSVAPLSNGGFVVSFTDERAGNDGSATAVRAQAYDAYGNPFGHEVLVNKTTANRQENSFVLGLGNSYTVLFDDYSGSPDKPSALTIRGRTFSMEGVEKQGEFVLPVTGSAHSNAKAGVLNDGRYVITWEGGSDGSSGGVRGQIFNQDGTRFNGEFQVNSVTFGTQGLSSVVGLQNGGFAIVYTHPSVASSDYYLAMFDSSGRKQTANDLPIGTAHGSGWRETHPKITALADGRIIIAWSDAIQSTTGNAYIQIVDPREQAVALNGTSSADQYIGTAYDDRLNGASGDDALRGEAGNDVIDGGVGRDLMNGGAGDDTYHVDNAGDSIVDASGTDTVVSSISYALPAFLEHLTAFGAGAITLTGNALANTLTGNGAANVLDGAAGSDVMIGGDGDDTYSVDNSGDRIVETSSGGAGDQILTSVNYALSDFIENMTAKGAGAISLTGNGSNNILTGNAAANVITGGTGADRMIGGDGNDTYDVDNTGDQVVEAASGGTSDLVYSSINLILADHVEQLVGTGSGKLTLAGNSLGNAVTGNAAANKINGGLGNDQLTGGLGKDSFVFDTKLNAKSNKDKILDWNTKDDTIRLENKIFTKLKKTGTLKKDYFVLGSKAKDKNDFIGYNKKTGDLWYDTNGSGKGGQVVFANIGKNKKIFHDDFVII
jgi:Ca2+-binding RTX toxin-like protein